MINLPYGRNLTIKFEAKLSKIGSWIITRLPKSASVKLPSRGMVMVEGTVNDFTFQAALEPDGKGGHWFRVDEALLKTTKVAAGETVILEIKPMKIWPEPEVPEDLKKSLAVNKEAYKTWMDITTIARFDWIRWIQSTKNPKTRKLRIEKTFSKFKDGIRRPCCFNRSMCTVPEVSHNRILLEPI